MPQSDVFSLGRSELSAFLFAQIGVEQNGMTLSVISGLARLGVDPWAEAARLSVLPGPAAIEALARKIATISGGSWKPDAGRIAERLIRLLPQGTGAVAPPGAPATGSSVRKLALRAPNWLIWVLLGALALATLADRTTIFGDRRDEPAQPTNVRP